MNQQDSAQARSRAYYLFGHILLHGMVEDLLPVVQAVPSLSRSLPATMDNDQAAAAHQHLFGFNVFPYESIFLDAEAMLGGRISDRVQVFYSQAGYQPSSSAEGPDHIGYQLDLLSSLTATEAEAWRKEDETLGLRSRDLQRVFLDGHLLRWLPALTQAVQQQGSGFYASVTALALDLVLEHRHALGPKPADHTSPFELPPLPPLLEEEKTGLADIVRYLLTPALSGFYLSRDDIGRLGRHYRLPRGFGERRQMLTNLLRSAAEYDALPQLLVALQSLVDRWASTYAVLSDRQLAVAQDIAGVWLDRLVHTKGLLLHMRAAGGGME